MTPDKPLLRGVSHQVGFFVAVVASAVLVARAPARAHAAQAALVFGTSLALLLGTSALYHRVHWSPAARQRMRRLDHAAIFVLIAGGYTPLFALVPGRDGGHTALAAVWGGAAIGVVKSVAWPGAPKWLTAIVCVGVGWMSAFAVFERAQAVGSVAIGVLVASGIVYSVGALVYALKRPDPLPRIFGYHEVFHALVLVASCLLYTHVALVLRAV